MSLVNISLLKVLKLARVKSGIMGQTAKFRQPPCLLHSSVIRIKMN